MNDHEVVPVGLAEQILNMAIWMRRPGPAYGRVGLVLLGLAAAAGIGAKPFNPGSGTTKKPAAPAEKPKGGPAAPGARVMG